MSLLVGFLWVKIISCSHLWLRATASLFVFCSVCPGKLCTAGWSMTLIFKVPLQEFGYTTPFCKEVKCKAERQEKILLVWCKAVFLGIFLKCRWITGANEQSIILDAASEELRREGRKTCFSSELERWWSHNFQMQWQQRNGLLWSESLHWVGADL